MTAISEPIDMEVFQDAIHTWFSESMDIQVIWRNQNAPRPDYPYGSLLITSGPIPISPFAEERQSYDAARSLGKEIELDELIACQFMISCQVYVAGDEGRDPKENASALINKALISLSLRSKLAALWVKKIAFIRTGGIQNIPEEVGNERQSRANMDVTFTATLSVAEYIGYIEKVEAKSVNLGIDQTFGVGV